MDGTRAALTRPRCAQLPLLLMVMVVVVVICQ